MARVNLEERFFAESRLRYAAQDLEVPEHVVIGALVLLWHESQERQYTTGSTQDIGRWSQWDRVMDHYSEQGRGVIPTSRLVDVLTSYDYLEKVGENTFEIVGNSAQISGLIAHKKRTEKATMASVKARKKRAKQCDENSTSRSTSRLAQVGRQVQPNSIQFNAIQGNSIQPTKQEDGWVKQFETLWKIYNNKARKPAAEDAYYSRIQCTDNGPQFAEAVRNYTNFCVTHQRKKLDFARFIYDGEWLQWVTVEDAEPERGSSILDAMTEEEKREYGVE